MICDKKWQKERSRSSTHYLWEHLEINHPIQYKKIEPLRKNNKSKSSASTTRTSHINLDEDDDEPVPSPPASSSSSSLSVNVSSPKRKLDKETADGPPRVIQVQKKLKQQILKPEKQSLSEGQSLS